MTILIINRTRILFVYLFYLFYLLFGVAICHGPWLCSEDESINAQPTMVISGTYQLAFENGPQVMWFQRY